MALKGMNYWCRLSAGSGRQNGVDEFTVETLVLCQASVFLGRLSDLGPSPRKCSARAGEARRLEGKATLLLCGRCAEPAKAGDLGRKACDN